ncbi:hypothetical protein EDC94DRAFT_59148 [Helicostylum pulchrum]|nr:hypothetical protein EDC94DRAFT_59148 [Helicostylum pulchrum]
MVIFYCKFIPGETRLQEIKYQLEDRGLSTSKYYNADGMPFGLKDIKRETTDHVKGAYGLLAMIHKVAYSFIYADDDIFFRFKVYFIHATGKKKKIRLWVLRASQ